ncbi:amino acid permease [Micrococcus porci]|uniref:amino acid permease n=1 Tax=Micrococcus porci TaxID=2856555 RepID=UPI003CF432DE
MQSTPAPEAPAQAQLQRGLNTRHITFIALGTAVGTGLFYGSAAGIQAAGPGVVLAFMLAGAAVYLVMRALGEMAVREPISGSFVAYASRYLGPFAGFLTGWTYVFELAVVIVADTTAVTVYMAFWYPDVPAWVWVAATMVVLGLINVTHVGSFGEAEFWFSLIKVLAIVGMIFGGVILMFSGASFQDGVTPGPHNLVEHGGFLPHGLMGVLTALTIVTFSFGGTETLGIAAGEAEDPESALPRAVNTVPVRILFFYLGSMLVIMSLVPWTTVDGETSPFVQIFKTLGVPFAPHLLNFVVLTAAVSAINACIFTNARLLHHMAHDGHAPRVFTAVTRGGVPWVTVVAMLGVMAAGAVFMSVKEDTFGIVAGVATFAVVFTWALILASHLGMRRALARHGQAPGAFPMPGGRVGAWLGLAFVAVVAGTMAFEQGGAVLGALGGPDALQTALAQPFVIGVLWLAVLAAAWAVPAVRRSARRHDCHGTPPPLTWDV